VYARGVLLQETCIKFKGGLREEKLGGAVADRNFEAETIRSAEIFMIYY
jgi:hypothetical protein